MMCFTAVCIRCDIPSIAANNPTPWYKNSCIQNALLKGAGSTALDAVGFVPGESQTVAAVQTLVGFGSIVNSMAHQDWTGAGIGTTGTVTTVAGLAVGEMGVSWAKAVPGIGLGVNTIGTGLDLIKTISAGYQAYKACMNGQQ
jgi:hypothetical protein